MTKDLENIIKLNKQVIKNQSEKIKELLEDKKEMEYIIEESASIINGFISLLK